MPGYNIYVSEKSSPELVEVFNKMKADGVLSEFITESCETSLPKILERKVTESQAQKEWYEGIMGNYTETKEKTDIVKYSKKNEYIEILPRDKTTSELMGWLTSPASARDWQAAGFRSAKEVIDAAEEYWSATRPPPRDRTLPPRDVTPSVIKETR